MSDSESKVEKLLKEAAERNREKFSKENPMTAEQHAAIADAAGAAWEKRQEEIQAQIEQTAEEEKQDQEKERQRRDQEQERDR